MLIQFLFKPVFNTLKHHFCRSFLLLFRFRLFFVFIADLIVVLNDEEVLFVTSMFIITNVKFLLNILQESGLEQRIRITLIRLNFCINVCHHWNKDIETNNDHYVGCDHEKEEGGQWVTNNLVFRILTKQFGVGFIPNLPKWQIHITWWRCVKTDS